MKLPLRQKLNIIPLLLYWPAIFVVTHISVPQPVREAHVFDKVFHFLAYLVLAFLFWFAVRPGRKVDWKKAAVWIALAVMIIYGVFDECFQGFVGRTPAVSDFFANLAGVIVAFVLLSILNFLPAALVISTVVILSATSVTRENPAEAMPGIYVVFHLFGYAVFSLLWVLQLNCKFPSLRRRQLKSFFVAFLLPMILLVLVIVISSLVKRAISTSDIVAALIGIGVVIVVWGKVCIGGRL